MVAPMEAASFCFVPRLRSGWQKQKIEPRAGGGLKKPKSAAPNHKKRPNFR